MEETFAQNLNDDNQKLLGSDSSWDLGSSRTGAVVRTAMNDCLEALS